jgi:ribosomal protein S18 acetylase RimI-like enzyme
VSCPAGSAPAPRGGRCTAAFCRFLGLESRLEERHGRDVAQPHWYLLLLAVDPLSQGCGVGSRLMAPAWESAGCQYIRLPSDPP